MNAVCFKWKGIKTKEVSIPAMSCRNLDAFYVVHSSPSTINLGINQFLTDFSGYYDDYTLDGPGKYELEFVVHSSNFSSSRSTFKLSIGKKLDSVKFMKKSQRWSRSFILTSRFLPQLSSYNHLNTN